MFGMRCDMKAIKLKVKGENKGHYVPGMVSGNLLFISGQLSLDLDTRKVAEGEIENHTALAMHNIERVLEAAGVGRENVISCRIYTSEIENWDRINQVYSDFFGEHKPARIVVAVPSLHFGCKVEIEAVAELYE